MKYDYFELETISYDVRQNIKEKFRSKYSQDDLNNIYPYHLPVFVRWNNRNVYGIVYYSGTSFFVSNFYRLKRDGTPVRLYADLMSD